MRVAIVHDYLNQAGGAERVVGVLHQIFPDAPIYTTILDKEKLISELKEADIRTTWMQKIPGINKHFKTYFWLYPLAMKSITLSEYDLIISSSSAYAKGVRKSKDSIHICYCHTPMRFAWDFDTYMNGVNIPKFLKFIAKMMVAPLRLWDKTTSKGVDYYIANSSIVQKRIKQNYDLPSKIIFPPVNLTRFKDISLENDEYYLVVSRLVSYKKIDLAIEACTKLGKRLVIIGDGPDRTRLESIAGPSVEFLGRISDKDVESYMKKCKAFIFPGIEDFGITPLEVNACGRPVIAFRAGGALDSIKSGVNGMYFEEQNVNALMEVLNSFDSKTWNPREIRKHAENFSEERFIKELKEYINLVLK
ncbi:glycosyltransferase [Bacillus sp. PS06]|nr:glycosyltransferase [Bacillus sp. PS06]